MILIDTSVWIGHFRASNATLAGVLEEGLALIHPFVIGELACGKLRNRARILANLNALPCAVSATHDEVLRLIEDRKLWGSGLGWIDAHLVASALVTRCRFWTLDRKLNRAASAAGVEFPRRR
jgi:hypothetical protein